MPTIAESRKRYCAEVGPPTGGRGKARTNNPSYSGAHRRLGSAKGRTCADCGGPATEWGFKDEKGFSADPDDYRPLCHPCNKAQSPPRSGLTAKKGA